MLRLSLLILFLIGLSTAKPVVTAEPDPFLMKRIDSLSQALKDSKIAAEYANHTLEATREANENVRSQFGYFVGGVLGVLVISFVVLGLIIRDRSEKERDFLVGQVMNRVKTDFETKFMNVATLISSVESQQRTLDDNYRKTLSAVENKIRTLENSNQDNLKSISSLSMENAENKGHFSQVRDQIFNTSLSFFGLMHDFSAKQGDAFFALTFLKMMLSVIDIRNHEGKYEYEIQYKRAIHNLVSCLGQHTNFEMKYFNDVKGMFPYFKDAEQRQFALIEEDAQRREPKSNTRR